MLSKSESKETEVYSANYAVEVIKQVEAGSDSRLL